MSMYVPNIMKHDRHWINSVCTVWEILCLPLLFMYLCVSVYFICSMNILNWYSIYVRRLSTITNWNFGQAKLYVKQLNNEKCIKWLNMFPVYWLKIFIAKRAFKNMSQLVESKRICLQSFYFAKIADWWRYRLRSSQTIST